MQFPHPDSRILPSNIKCVNPPLHNSKSDEQEKIVGSLVGLAIGDALGASVEFRPRQYLLDHPVNDMQGGGTWGLDAGQWTDDTSMALCLASSLITQHQYNPYDQMVRYKWWYKKGFLSSTGQCFDIGSTTRSSLEKFCERQNILKQYYKNAKEEVIDNLPLEDVRRVQNFNECCGETGEAGNGPLMRLAPVPLFYFRQPDIAVQLAGESARLTHGDVKAVDACRYYAALIVAAISGEPKKDLLHEQFYESHRKWFGSEPLHPDIVRVAQGSYKKQGGYNEGIRGKNYIINTLEAALWAFWSDENSFEIGALNAVNLGDDTDTTAAVYGQLAGAYYGASAILRHWGKKLYAVNLLVCTAEWLYYEGSRIQSNRNQQQQQQQRMPNPQSSTHQHSTTIKPVERMGYNTQNTKNTKPDPSKLPAAGMPSGGFKYD
ncbi:unnamed protein product [Adineta steineri]|uniref:ADP-ribosylglycohydrolase n=1 Tax=Adineta steineri TaxID=433720 RepID=A0A814NZK9_9BILA|nr:unnamed protein product [Adineta steineri]CAF1100696.1 unnamed protein product [Adineta steineri]